ncbi:hypothetical protein [Campylobacter sp. VTCC 70190]|uniref:hypothetical protein n=1 Tax=Campylobacter sp. VTCC 70190 TaxID=3392118 RepID=UPI00398E5C8E
MLDYSKYENASEKQLIHALSLVEKELDFLKNKLNEVKNKEYKNNFDDEPTKETIQTLKNAKSIGIFDNFNDFKKALES